MPYLIMAIIGGALGLYLVQTGRVTSRRLVWGMYAVIGALLGIFVLRAVVGAMGPLGALIGATTGAVVLLWLGRSMGPKE